MFYQEYTRISGLCQAVIFPQVWRLGSAIPPPIGVLGFGDKDKPLLGIKKKVSEEKYIFET
jgi:hypothetical protein